VKHSTPVASAVLHRTPAFVSLQTTAQRPRAASLLLTDPAP